MIIYQVYPWNCSYWGCSERPGYFLNNPAPYHLPPAQAGPQALSSTNAPKQSKPAETQDSEMRNLIKDGEECVEIMSRSANECVRVFDELKHDSQKYQRRSSNAELLIQEAKDIQMRINDLQEKAEIMKLLLEIPYIIPQYSKFCVRETFREKNKFLLRIGEFKVSSSDADVICMKEMKTERFNFVLDTDVNIIKEFWKNPEYKSEFNLSKNNFLKYFLHRTFEVTEKTGPLNELNTLYEPRDDGEFETGNYYFKFVLMRKSELREEYLPVVIRLKENDQYEIKGNFSSSEQTSSRFAEAFTKDITISGKVLRELVRKGFYVSEKIRNKRLKASGLMFS
jgi:hypothetical protein